MVAHADMATFWLLRVLLLLLRTIARLRVERFPIGIQDRSQLRERRDKEQP